MSGDTPAPASRGETASAGNQEEKPRCEQCGDWDAQEMGGRRLCVECIALAGCSCAGAAPEDE